MFKILEALVVKAVLLWLIIFFTSASFALIAVIVMVLIETIAI